MSSISKKSKGSSLFDAPLINDINKELNKKMLDRTSLISVSTFAMNVNGGVTLKSSGRRA